MSLGADAFRRFVVSAREYELNWTDRGIESPGAVTTLISDLAQLQPGPHSILITGGGPWGVVMDVILIEVSPVD